MSINFLRKIIAFSIILLFWTNPLLKAQTKKEEKFIKESLTKLGASMGNFGYTLLKNGTTAKEAYVSEDQKALDQMVKGYQKGVAAGRGTIGLLDTTLDIAITGTELYTGGAALIATAGVRYAKNKGLNYVMEKIEDDQRKFLAANLNSFEKQSGLKFDVLSKKNPQEIIQAIDKVDAFKAMKDKLGDDPKAKALFENSIIDTIKNVQKSTLLKVAANTGDIKKLETQMVSMNRNFSQYIDQTNTALSSLSNQLGETQVAIEKANKAIDDLRKDTTKNTQQLQALTEVAFSKGSAQDRLILLEGGYLKDVLNETDLATLKDSVKSQAKKEELVAQMNNVVNKFNQVSQIATNIGIKLPDEINQAIAFADTASKAVSSIMSGDYLGAIVGITGLFGPPRPDPAAERHKQLMNFLQENFAEVNRKLDQIIEGQQRIMEGLVALSEQAAEYDKALHERLDRVEYQLGTVQSMVRELLYRPLGTCGDTRQQIIDRIGDDDTTKIQKVLGTSPVIASGIKPCADYLRVLFYQTFDPDKFNISPLAIEYSKDAGNTGQFAVSQENQKKYYDDPRIKKFLENQYKPQSIFFINQSKTFQLTSHVSLAALTLPTRNIKGLDTKLTQFKNNSNACSKGTILSNPLISLLCYEKGKPTPSLLTLPETSPTGLEDIAIVRSNKLLNNVLAHDDTETLAEWALFYAPLYDIYDFTNNRIPANGNELMRIFADESYGKSKPGGQILLEGALKVVTVSLAQMNMLYGDVPAKMVFQNLWDPANKKFLDAPNIPGNCTPGSENNCKFADLTAQQQAFLIFKNNPYIQRNVLLLALNDLSNLNGPGEKIAYQSAIDWMKNATVNPDGQLKAAFGDKLNFVNIVRESTNFPAANIYGIEITLPSADEFNKREFVYPQTLRRILTNRDLIANRIADYEAIEWAAQNSSDPVKEKEMIVNTLVKVSN
jgi:hypothetical protein